MSDFEYVVAFYALLLGLAVANVAIGFADMWRERERRRIGWCPPLLAATVLFAAMNTWLSNWVTHQVVRVDAWQMIAALGICLPYVFVSRAMTPPEGTEIGLEEHYLKSRLPILLALALPPLFTFWSMVRLDHFRIGGVDEAWLVVRFLLPVGLMLAPSPTVQRLGLAALCGLLVFGLFR